MIDFDDVVIFYPGGSGGSFVRAIFKYYLTDSLEALNVINKESGDCHRAHEKNANSLWPWPANGQCHWPSFIPLARQTLKKNAVIVCIRPSHANAYTIVKMMYHKHFKNYIKLNPEEAVKNWPELAGHLQNPELIFLSDISKKIAIDDWNNVDMAHVDLRIDFDTIIGKDKHNLNKIIADFLQIPVRPEVDEFIAQYRTINQQYLD
jgi:hypothetical protein